VNTGIACENSSVTGSGSELALYVLNDGKTKLAEYSSWDVIVRYQDGDTVWIPYSSSTPGWQYGGFFFPGTTGDLRANILNPGEAMLVNIKLSPAVSESATNLATVVAPNGTTSEITFGW